MKILIDMNLAPRWRDFFERHHISSSHWSEVGEPNATDQAIMDWARQNGYVVLTHDLDFSAILAATREGGPSVVQIRKQKVLPEAIGELVIEELRRNGKEIDVGAIIVIEPSKSRVRMLPIKR